MSEWIDIKDRKPDKDGRYLIVDVYSNYSWVGVCSLRDGKWDSPSVKYWMLLPEAPK